MEPDAIARTDGQDLRNAQTCPQAERQHRRHDPLAVRGRLRTSAVPERRDLGSGVGRGQVHVVGVLLWRRWPGRSRRHGSRGAPQAGAVVGEGAPGEVLAPRTAVALHQRGREDVIRQEPDAFILRPSQELRHRLQREVRPVDRRVVGRADRPHGERTNASPLGCAHRVHLRLVALQHLLDGGHDVTPDDDVARHSNSRWWIL